MGYFGGKKTNILEDYVKPKINLFEQYKRVQSGGLGNDECLIPLMNWFSNHEANIINIQKINKRFFYVNKKILNRQLSLKINQNIRFIKYPKKPKNEHPYNFLIPYIQKFYSWSDKEWNFYKDFFDLNDEKLHIKLHRNFAFDKKECRKLGIKIEKINVKYEAVNKTKGFFQ